MIVADGMEGIVKDDAKEAAPWIEKAIHASPDDFVMHHGIFRAGELKS